MSDVDQRRFDNQPSDYVSARAAAELLGIKLATLYAYASRGMVASVAGEAGRARRYLRADLERLRARHDARAGHGPVAAGALRWGEPVLESALTSITEAGALYRGQGAVALARAAVPFESVAELLWTATLPERAPEWRVAGPGIGASRLAALLPDDSTGTTALSILVPALGARDEGRFGIDREAVIPRARALIVRMAAALAVPRRSAHLDSALRSNSVAGTLTRALGARGGRDGVAAINGALVLCADHELNVSTFAARVAASAGADVYACVSAALAALSGPEHGGMCDRVEALVAEAGSAARASHVIRDRGRRGDSIPGFGHRLYPSGDPRTAPLLEAAGAVGGHSPHLQTVLALVAAMKDATGAFPTLDIGLVALAGALAMPRGSAVSLFAIGRAAGWIAHVLEQYEAGFLLRPRARYVGP